MKRKGYDLDQKREEASLRMFKDSRDWPCWPLLPVKEMHGGPGLPRLGYLVADDDFAHGILHVYEGNIYCPAKDDPVILTANGAEDLLRKGWIVD